MNYLKRHVQCLSTIFLFTTLLCVFSSCKKDLNFKNSQDAINLCREELQDVKSKRSVNIKELTNCVASWQVLQDSVYSYLGKNKKIDKNGNTARTFFIISDSIREEISRLAFSEERTMSDVIYLKENTAFNRDKIINSDNYKEAKTFFENLDEDDLFQGARRTLEEYAWLMTHINKKKFSNENDFKKFLKQEDVCFRSFLEYINQVPPSAIKKLTLETSKFCENLYNGQNPPDMSQDKLTLYMTMRFNRRVLQNAQIYQKYIEDNKPISSQEIGSFRWTLIQPMFAIDNYSMATMTDDQLKDLSTLATKLPALLAYIDNQIGTSNLQSQRLQSTLTRYFLTSYLRNTL